MLPRPLPCATSVDVVLNRTPESVGTFLETHGHPDLDQDQVRDALRLMEMRRDGMLMYTSCGFLRFFDEISGLETTQCLHYAKPRAHLGPAVSPGRF